MNLLRIVGIAIAIPLGLLGLGLIALAVMLAEGRDEARKWWATQ